MDDIGSLRQTPNAPDRSGAASSTHLVLIPSYNPGIKLQDTLRAARAQWTPVWVIVDGSTDGSAEWLRQRAAEDPGLRVVGKPRQRRGRAPRR